MSHVSNQQLSQYINELLMIDQYQDYAPNGLQVEGSQSIRKIVTGVTASQELLEAAVKRGADAVLVHHGYFWKGEPEIITGMKYRRIATLMQHNMNLLAYHLPLDGHIKLGNNIGLAKRLDLKFKYEMPVKPGANIVMIGDNNSPVTAVQLGERIQQALGRQPLMLGPQASHGLVKKVAWCTGAGQDFLPQVCHYADIDAFITGEVSERTTHIARELGVYFYAAGHHATEKDGIKVLGEHIAHHFKVDVEFVDIDNPV